MGSKPSDKSRGVAPTQLLHAATARALPAIAMIVIAAVAGVFGLGFARAQVEREVYRDRLAELTDRYDQLELRFNDAVRKTALTELVVDDDRSVAVGVRTVQGRTELIETPFDGRREIYVDYAIIEGRVQIRRVFDDQTPPSQALVINPSLADVNWDDIDDGSLGQAVYRSLQPGRWVIDVTGSGALGLRQAAIEEPITLESAPQIESFEEIQREAESAAAAVTWKDVLSKLLGW
ncbi:MAG: hypothetical protein AAGI17_00005 [Planctomycetota bacterium]